MLPLQSVDLASTHSGEEPAGHVVPEVGQDGGPDLLHLFQRERPEVRSPPPQPLHTLECIRSAEALAGFGTALSQQATAPVARGRGKLCARAHGNLDKPGTERQYVSIVDG